MSSKRLVLIDGSGYIFRAFYALPPMSRSDGTPVNAVFGFTSMLLKLSEDMSGDHLLVVFDAARKTFRNEIYKDYKANRSEPPDELIPQFSLIRDSTDALGLVSLEIEGFEADDIIASFVKLAKEINMESLIVSSDKDLMQLVQNGVSLHDPMKNIDIGSNQVFEKFGVTPDKVVDVQALAGDASDNVPGVPGIGIKTAALLINQFGSLESLLKNTSNIPQNKRRESLINNAEMARISKLLVKLDQDVPLPISIKDLEWKERDNDVLLKFLRENNFKRLESKIISSSVSKNQLNEEKEIEINYELITDIKRLNFWVNEAKRIGLIAVDTETTSLDAVQAKLVGVSIALYAGKACYIPLRHIINNGNEQELFLNENKLSTESLIEQIPVEIVLPILKDLFEDCSVLKIGHNIKYDMLVLKQPDNGMININSFHDTMCMSYVIDASRFNHKLDTLSLDILNYTTIKFEEVCGKGSKQIKFDCVNLQDALTYAAEDADVCLRLYERFKNELFENKLNTVYETLERSLIEVLVNMEAEGILLDKSILNKLSIEFSEKLNDLEKEIFSISSCEFNIASPKQLGEVLFDKMNIPGGKKTKSGGYGTSANILEELSSDGYEVASKIIDWRGLAKLKSTYTDALQKSINPKLGRVHTSYSMASASTGRLASTNPNLQNIPIRTSDGKRIRGAFISKSGNKLLSADYSQIELRLIAHAANEEAMIEAFISRKDIHAETASQVFNVPLEEIDNEMRRRAKAINFGIIYGISPFGLSKQLRCSLTESKQFIESYFERFPKIKTFMSDMIQQAKVSGYVETFFGRKIPINGINSKNFSERSFAERQAINAPIQGSAADIIKRAMICINKNILAEKWVSKMLLQVHDELVFECPDNELDKMVLFVKNQMENAHLPLCNLLVPLTVDCGTGLTWAEAH